MTLGDLLEPENVVPEMKATDRWEAIEELVENLVSTGKIRADSREEVVAVVKNSYSLVSEINV